MQVETETVTTETENSGTETTTSTETPSTETSTEKIDLGAETETETSTETETKTEGEVDERYGAPEGEADYEITLPEGQTVDEEAMKIFSPELKALNLSNASANQLVGVFAEKVLPHYQAQFQKDLEADIVTTRTGWEAAARDLIAGKDKDGNELKAQNKAGEDLSFDGKDLKGVQSVAAKVLDKYAPAGFREFLNDTGLGVHPQMIALMYQLGKATAEDGDFETAAPAKVELTREEKYYPKR